MGMLPGEILSVHRLEEIKNNLNTFKNRIDEFNTAYDNVITKFESNDTVQNFFTAGPFGITMKERFDAIKKAVDEYYLAMSSDPRALIPITETFIKEQEELLNSGAIRNPHTEDSPSSNYQQVKPHSSGMYNELDKGKIKVEEIQ